MVVETKKLYELSALSKKTNKEKTNELRRLLEECIKGFGEEIVLTRCACELTYENRVKLKIVFEKIKEQFCLPIDFDNFNPGGCSAPPAMLLLTKWAHIHGIMCTHVFVYKELEETDSVRVGQYWLDF